MEQIKKILLQENNITNIFNNKSVNRLEAKKMSIDKKHNTTSSKPINDMVSITRELCDKITSIDDLKIVVENFKELSICKTATNTVFAEGNQKSKIMFIGEAPGAQEDLSAIPFCGQSGKLLDNFISFIGLSRSENAYITNSIFWRPPGNRKPTTEECKTCLPFVEKHISLLNPNVIILVGSTSAQALLGENIPISQMRKKRYEYSNQYLSKSIQTCVIFHPSYLLRQPSQKKLFWQDLLEIRKEFLSS